MKLTFEKTKSRLVLFPKLKKYCKNMPNEKKTIKKKFQKQKLLKKKKKTKKMIAIIIIVKIKIK
jgi:hypothetical protein